MMLCPVLRAWGTSDTYILSICIRKDPGGQFAHSVCIQSESGHVLELVKGVCFLDIQLYQGII